MLTTNAFTSISLQAAQRRLIRAGFHAVDIQEDGGRWNIFGTNPMRKDEHGGDAHISEEDRQVIEGAFTAESSLQASKQRARELNAKPVLTAPEQSEAIRLLLSLIVDS